MDKDFDEAFDKIVKELNMPEPNIEIDVSNIVETAAELADASGYLSRLVARFIADEQESVPEAAVLLLPILSEMCMKLIEILEDVEMDIIEKHLNEGDDE